MLSAISFALSLCETEAPQLPFLDVEAKLHRLAIQRSKIAKLLPLNRRRDSIPLQRLARVDGVARVIQKRYAQRIGLAIDSQFISIQRQRRRGERTFRRAVHRNKPILAPCRGTNLRDAVVRGPERVRT